MAHRLYVPLDVDYASDPKIMAAGHVGETMYVRGLALAKRTLSDGYIAAAQLPLLAVGLPGRATSVACRLVEAGLWSPVDGGWLITSWLAHNRTRAAIEDEAERKRQASLQANHERWHVDGKRSPTCPVCYPPPSPNGVRPASDSESGSHPRPKVHGIHKDKPEPEPEPEPEKSIGKASAAAENLSSADPPAAALRKVHG